MKGNRRQEEKEFVISMVHYSINDRLKFSGDEGMSCRRNARNTEPLKIMGVLKQGYSYELFGNCD